MGQGEQKFPLFLPGQPLALQRGLGLGHRLAQGLGALLHLPFQVGGIGPLQGMLPALGFPARLLELIEPITQGQGQQQIFQDGTQGEAVVDQKTAGQQPRQTVQMVDEDAEDEAGPGQGEIARRAETLAPHPPGGQEIEQEQQAIEQDKDPDGPDDGGARKSPLTKRQAIQDQGNRQHQDGHAPEQPMPARRPVAGFQKLGHQERGGQVQQRRQQEIELVVPPRALRPEVLKAQPADKAQVDQEKGPQVDDIEKKVALARGQEQQEVIDQQGITCSSVSGGFSGHKKNPPRRVV